jgi:hypothetical protein
MLDANALVSLVEIGLDFFVQWRLVDEGATAINRVAPPNAVCGRSLL